MENNYLLETNHLHKVLEEIKLIKEDEILRFKNLPSMYKSDPRLLESLMSLTSVKINNLKNSEEKPYFARIDFIDDADNKNIISYIGKIGSINDKGDVVVTDWRAPISSLYYDGHLGKVKYLADSKEITGNLNLKRQIIIEKSKLINIFDVDSVSDDELLKPYLGASADNRLKNIVASIQSEQNDIIRTDLNKNIIIQGVAGSGKTTVALHRIAYLVYNYSKKYTADQFMVIGPNKFFINYISTVLPDLDVGNAVQCTFEELSSKYINEKFETNDPVEKLVKYIKTNHVDSYLKFKTSMKYKEAIDKFLKEFENSIMPNEDLVINNCLIYTKEEIKNIYLMQSKLDNISQRVEVTIKLLINKLKLDTAKHNEIKVLFDINNFKLKPDERQKLKWETIKELEKGASKYIKQYLNIANVKILKLYYNFIQNLDKYVEDEEILNSDIVIKTMQNINLKKMDFEDIPALMYINIILNGTEEYKKYIHVVVDEAQDFGEFNFYVIDKLMPNATYSIFGDITQGIYSFRGISNWNDVINNSFNNNCSLMRLEKSYRTTIEIMETANKFSMYLDLGKALPVIRHGKEVSIIKQSSKDQINYLLNSINEKIKLGYKSIAIISKTPERSKYIYDELKKLNIQIEDIIEDNESYNGGICSVTAYLSKGLEFDAVIITDADESIYYSNNEIDMKLMYVACSRALHELEIIYENEVVKPLK